MHQPLERFRGTVHASQASELGESLISVESGMHQYLPKFLPTLSVWEHITQQPGLHNGFIWTSAFHHVKGEVTYRDLQLGQKGAGIKNETQLLNQNKLCGKQDQTQLQVHQVKSVQHEALWDHGAPTPQLWGPAVMSGTPNKSKSVTWEREYWRGAFRSGAL